MDSINGRIGISKGWLGKTGVPGEKPLGAKEKTNNKLNPQMASTPRFEPGPRVGGECSHHCAIPCSPKLGDKGEEE